MFSNASLMQSPFYWNIIDNQFTDFTSEWYLSVGPMIVFIMMWKAVTPVVDFLKIYIVKAIVRGMDGGWRSCRKSLVCKNKKRMITTKSKTVQ